MCLASLGLLGAFCPLAAAGVSAADDPPAVAVASLDGGGQLTVRSRTAAGNHLSVSKSGVDFVVRDARGPVTAGHGCRAAPHSRKAVCHGSVTKVAVVLSPRADWLSVHVPVPVRASGGRGSDWLSARMGQAAPVVFDGGPGDDMLYGGDSGDVLTGGHGDDILAGGPGRDTVSYAGRPTPVTVSLDGIRRNDGGAGEEDSVRGDVENIVGTGAADTLVGNFKDNRIWGHGGDDLIRGLAGRDSLFGGSGNDFVFGGAGPDAAFGDGGADYLGGLDGAAGNDRMHGGNRTDICTADEDDARRACERWR